jgi:hypothetical protein
MPAFNGSFELPVPVAVTDTSGRTVFRAVVNMWLTPKSGTAK